MDYRNLADVVAQLRAAGMDLASVKKANGGALAGEVYVGSTKSVRCDTSDRPGKQSGAYRLREFQTQDGGWWLSGSYWLDHGSTSFKIDINKECAECGADIPLRSGACPACGSKKKPKTREVSAEEVAAHKKFMEESRRQAAAADKAAAGRAAAWANAVWLKCREVADIGEHDYLGRKQLASAHGARLFESLDGVMLEGAEKDDYQKLGRYLGALAVPMCDDFGRRRGLQFILSRAKHKELIAARDYKDKDYWPRGLMNDGLHYVIGGAMHDVGLVCEGFATGASLYEASGIPVAVAFDAGGVPKVGELIWRFRKKRINLLYCADDDWLQRCIECKKPTPIAEAACAHCGKPHGKGNAGVAKAREAAGATAGAWLIPTFSAPRPADKKGPTDFNDLHCLEGLQPVRAQIEQKLAALEWRMPRAFPPPLAAAGLSSNGGGGGAENPPRLAMLSPEDVAARFSPVWSTDDVYYFDHVERVICAKASLTGRMTRHGWDIVVSSPEWQAKPEVSLDQVDFDPAGTDAAVVYNLWSGWKPLPRPAGASCDAILELWEHLCSYEADVARELFEWTLKWAAYPLQNIGAKMQSCILMHGGQGAGKNTVFNNLLDIYDREYAVEFGPKQLEKRFNALFSKKMLAIGNEIVASRDDLYHVKGQIKHMITEQRWVVEAKNKDERWERNCCNFIFLSNELRPAAIDRGDRRHCVIWTPDVPEIGEPERDAYSRRVAAANAERKNGGAAALYDYLMRIDLSGFDAATWPPMTDAKRALIEDNLDSRERFWALWKAEDVGDLPCVPCRSEDIYDAYRTWAMRTGIGRSVAQHSLVSFLKKQRGVSVAQERYHTKAGIGKQAIVFPYPESVPDGKHKSVWLGECVEEFQTALATFKSKGGE